MKRRFLSHCKLQIVDNFSENHSNLKQKMIKNGVK